MVLPMDTSREIILPPSERKALEWMAALGAEGLRFELRPAGSGWQLLVPGDQRERAWEAIRAYEAANVGWPPGTGAPIDTGSRADPLWSGLWGSGFILMVFLCFGPYDAANPALRAAASDAAAIASGQWWRPITALTLHAGFVHLAGNAIFLTVLGGILCNRLGVGLAWALILLSGMAGNFLTAWTATGPHVAVGASTASFGALGMLAVLQAAENYHATGQWKSVWSRVWIPLGGGLAMLGLLGTAPGSDLVAHGFGFVSGMVAAVPFCLAHRLCLSDTWQAVLKVATVLLIMLAWRTAIRFAG